MHDYPAISLDGFRLRLGVQQKKIRKKKNLLKKEIAIRRCWFGYLCTQFDLKRKGNGSFVADCGVGYFGGGSACTGSYLYLPWLYFIRCKGFFWVLFVIAKAAVQG